MRALVGAFLAVDAVLTVALVAFFVETGEVHFLFAAGFPIAAAAVVLARALS